MAKSLVGFSDQLSSVTEKGEEYQHFIKSVLSQIHNDPLRKHSVKDGADAKVISDLKQVLEDKKGWGKLLALVEKFGANQ